MHCQRRPVAPAIDSPAVDTPRAGLDVAEDKAVVGHPPAMAAQTPGPPAAWLRIWLLIADAVESLP